MTDPALGEKQTALVDAITTRIWSGVPLNQYDYLAFVDVATVLEMPIRSGQRTPEPPST